MSSICIRVQSNKYIPQLLRDYRPTNEVFLTILGKQCLVLLANAIFFCFQDNLFNYFEISGYFFCYDFLALNLVYKSPHLTTWHHKTNNNSLFFFGFSISCQSSSFFNAANIWTLTNYQLSSKVHWYLQFMCSTLVVWPQAPADRYSLKVCNEVLGACLNEGLRAMQTSIPSVKQNRNNNKTSIRK